MEREAYLDHITKLLLYPRKIPYRSIDEVSISDLRESISFFSVVSNYKNNKRIICFEDASDLLMSLLQLDSKLFKLVDSQLLIDLNPAQIKNNFTAKINFQTVLGITLSGAFVIDGLTDFDTNVPNVWLINESILAKNNIPNKLLISIDSIDKNDVFAFRV